VSVKFFGQFLIEQGEVDAQQLRQAIEWMATQNVDLGTLAVRHGLLTPEDTRRVHREQRRQDAPFGEIAVQLGLLSPAQVEQLLREQDKVRVRLGEALVRLGHLSEDKLGSLLDAFKADQSAYEISTAEMLPAALKGNEMAAITLDLVKKLSARLAGVVVKMAPATSCSLAGDGAFNASVKIRGAQGLGLALVADIELAKKLGGAATAYLGRTPSRELVEDALGEFLNVVAGNAIALLERKGVACELDPPRLGQTPAGGHCFDLVTSAGRGVLVLVK
jgi:hypothetical protein